MHTLTKTFMPLLGCAAILLAVGCINPVATNTSLAIELSTPQDNLLLGDTQYSIRFNQNIELTEKGPLKEGIFLRLDDNSVDEVSPESAEIVGSVIKIALPNLLLNQIVQIRIAAGVIKNSQGSSNQEIIYSSQVVDSAFNTPLELSVPQDSLVLGNEYYNIRFNRSISPYGGKVLTEGILLRLGDENSAEIPPESAIIEGFNIKIALPSLLLNQNVRIRILSGLVEDSRGIINQELLINSQVVENAFNTALELITPQDNLVLGDEYYSIRFNRSISPYSGKVLKEGIFLRLGDENSAEVSPESAIIEGFNIKIALPSLLLNQVVRIRIAAEVIQDSQGISNQEIIYSSQVVDSSFNTPLELSNPQDSFVLGDEYYSIRFNRSISPYGGKVLTEGILLRLGDENAAEISPESAIIEGFNIKIALPSLLLNQNVRIRILSGLVEDSMGIINQELIISSQVVENASITALELSTPQDSLVLGDEYYSIRFNQSISLYGGKVLKDEVFLRLGNENSAEISPESAIIEGFNIKIALPNLLLNQVVQIRIAAGAIQDSQGISNQEIIYSSQVVDSTFNTPLELTNPQDSFVLGDEYYSIRFNRSISPYGGKVLREGIFLRLGDENSAEISPESAIIEGFNIKIALPNLLLNQNVRIRILSGLVEDSKGIINQELIISSQVAASAFTTALELSNPQDSLVLGDEYYSIRFNRSISLYSGKVLKDEVFLRLGDENSVEVSPDLALIEGFNIKIALPSLLLNQVVRIRIAAGVVQDSQGISNQEIIHSTQVIDSTFNTPLELSIPQDSFVLGDESYSIRFNRAISPYGGKVLKEGIFLRLGDENAAEIPPESAIIEGFNIKIALPNLLLNQNVRIRILSGLVEDSRGIINQELIISSQVVDRTFSTPIELLRPQDSFTLGHANYRIHFNQNIEAVAGPPLKEGIFLRFGGETTAEVSPESAAVEDSVIKITLPSLTGSQDVRVRIAAGIIQNIQGTPNEELMFTVLVIRDLSAPLLSGNQNTLSNIDDSYTLRFTEEIELAVSQAELNSGITLSIDGTEHSVSQASIDTDFPWYLVIDLPELNKAQKLSIFIDAGLVKDASNNTNFALKLLDIPIIDKQGPRVLLDVLEEITETDAEYSLPFDKTLRFVDDAARAREGIHLLAGGDSLAPSAVVISGSDKLLLTLPDLVGKSSISISIDAGIIKDANNYMNLPITLPEQVIRRDSVPPRLLDTQGSVLHLSDTYTLRFDEMIRARNGDLAALAAGIRLSIASQAAGSAESASITGNQLTITFSVSIQNGESLKIDIDDNLVEDRTGNAASGLSLSSQVQPDNVPPELGINDLEMGDNASEYRLLFNEKISNAGSPGDLKTGIQIRIGSNAAMTMDDAAIESDAKTILLDLPAITAGVAYISVAAGLVQDASNNVNSGLSLGPITIKDVTPPALLEAGSQDDLIQNSMFQKLKFTEKIISAVGALSSKVYFAIDSGAEKNALSATLLPDGKTLLVEHDRLTVQGALVTFRIAAGALEDEAGNAVAADLSLTQTVKADSQPPVHISTDDLREDETELKLRFSEDLSPVSGAALEAGVSVGDGSPSTQALRIDTDDAAVLLVTLPSIVAGDMLEITLAAGLFADVSGNANEAMTLSSITVLPENMPPGLLPPDSTDVEYSESHYTLVFDEAVFPVGSADDLAKKIGISVSGNRKVQAMSTALVGGEMELTFPLPDIARGDTLIISIEGGAVKDKRDNLNEAADLAELSVVDTTPPRLLETQDNVYERTSYTLRFDETISVKADTAAKIGAEVDGQTTAISSAVLGGDGQSLRLALAAAPGVGSSVVFSIEAGAVADSSGNDNEARTLSVKTVLNDPTPPALLADQDEIYEDSQNYLIRYDEHVVAVGDATALASGITLAIDGTVTALSAVSIDNVNRGILLSMPSLSVGQTMDIAIAADTVRDGVGNSNEAASYQKTVLAEITPPTAAENQDTLTDADSSFTIRLSEAVSPAANLAQNIVIWYDNQEHAVSSAALTAARDGILVEFPSLPAEASVKFIVEAGTLKDKRENLNLEFSLPSILVQDVTPPRLLEQQKQFSEGGVYTIAFTEDIELAEGITLEEFKANVVLTYTDSSVQTRTLQAGDNLWIEGANVKLDTSGGVMWIVSILQQVKVLYMIFPGGMLQDKAGNVIETAFNISPLFLHAALPVLGAMDYGEIHELDPFIEWSSTSDIARHVGTNYELVQNISIAIDGGDPFSPIYAAAVGKLKVFLPPVFEGQEVEITLKEGQIAVPFEYSAQLIGNLDVTANEEISHTYTVKGHEDRQVRTMAGFLVSGNFNPAKYDYLDEHNDFRVEIERGFFFDHPRGSIASFNNPMGIDIDSGGNIYVADLFNHRLRKITPRSVVTTAAGPTFGTSHNPNPGYYDGPAAVALLKYPTTVDIDSSGDIYILENVNRIVRRLSKGRVTTSADYSDSLSFLFKPNTYYKRGLESDFGDKILASLGASDDKFIIDKNNSPPVEFSDTGKYLTDIQTANGRTFASDYTGNIFEITYDESGGYTETVLFSLSTEMGNLFEGTSKMTALAVSEDGNTFYAAVHGTPRNGPAGETRGYIIRIEDYDLNDPNDDSYRATTILESFAATGTQLTEEEAKNYLAQKRHFISDYHYSPVQTFEKVYLADAYGLALDGNGHLIVSDFSNSLILKVFNPHL